MIKRTAFMMTAAAVLLAQPTLAQQHDHRAGQPMGQGTPAMGMMSGTMMDMMSQGMMMDMTVMAFQPGTLLHSASDLGLSADQIARIDSLGSEAQEAHGEHAQAAMAARDRASSALQGDAPDLNGYSEAFTEAARHMALAHVVMARTAIEARAVLTPAQRAKVGGARAMMQGMQGMMKR